MQSSTKIHSETLLRIINGSSSFCKGPRTSKVWKSKDPKGPRTLRLCLSEDLCKNNYSHLYFAVVTFLTKIQNWCYKTNKNLSKHNCQKNLDGKNYYCPKNLDGKNHYHPRILTNHKKVGSSRISFSLKFWSLVRNALYCMETWRKKQTQKNCMTSGGFVIVSSNK